MRAVVLFVVGFASGGAFAQDVGDRAEVVADAPSVRFLGETTPGPELRAGTTVLVVDVQGEQVRVAVGERFGWVPRAAVRAVASPPVIELTPVE